MLVMASAAAWLLAGLLLPDAEPPLSVAPPPGAPGSTPGSNARRGSSKAAHTSRAVTSTLLPGCRALLNSAWMDCCCMS